MIDLKHEEITKAIDRLSVLMNDDFHGFRSEIWNVLSEVYEAKHSTLRGDNEAINILELYCEHLTEQLDDCEYECHYHPTYGFVPEAGCPVHDK